MREDMESSNHSKKNVSKLLKKVESLYRNDLVKVLSNFHVNKYGNKYDLKSRVISLIETSDNKTYKQICRYIKKVYRENDKIENKALLKKRKIILEKSISKRKEKEKSVPNDDNNNSLDNKSDNNIDNKSDECSDESISQTDLWNISQISAQLPISPLSSSIRSAIDLVNQTTNSNSNSQSSLPPQLQQNVSQSPHTAQPHVSSLHHMSQTHSSFLPSTPAFMPFAHSSQTYNYPNAGPQQPQQQQQQSTFNFVHHNPLNTQTQQQSNTFLPRHPQPQQTRYCNPHASNVNLDQGFQPINYSNKNNANNSNNYCTNEYYNRMANTVNSTPNYTSSQTYYPSFYNINNQSSQQSASYAPYNQYSSQTNPFAAHSHNLLPNPCVATQPTKNVLPDGCHLNDTPKSLLLLQEQNELLTQAYERREYYFKHYYKFHKITHLVKPTIIPSLSDNVIARQFDFKNVNLPMLQWYEGILNEAILRVNSIQVQLRFGDIKEIKVNEQRDSGFENLCININGKKLYRYTETGDFNEPFDISSLCVYKAQAINEIHFWLDKPNSEWLFPCVFEVSIVKCNTPESLLCKLKQSLSQHLNPEHTKSIIQRRHQTSQDNDVSLLYNQNMKVKLICPLSFDRINTPCRTINCQHIDCFDGLSFFKMNDLKYDWYCPICHTSASYDLLRIDGYFTEILTISEESCKEVVFSSDGKWQMASDIREEIIELDDSSMGSLSPIDSYQWSDDDDDIVIIN